MIFDLMNKDIRVAILEVTPRAVHLLEVTDGLPGYIKDIQSWVDDRTSPVGRNNIRNLVKLAELDTRQEYLSVAHGVSLTDTFWVKEPESNLCWSKVSPYRNPFSRIISEVALNGSYRGGCLRSQSPEYTLDGSADKCWKRENGEIRMYKTSGEKWSGITGNRPYCEFYASQIAEALIDDKSHFVPYRIHVSKTRSNLNKPYVSCPIFTDEKNGYLPMCDSAYRGLDLRELDKRLMDRDRLIIREMLLLDSIILNYDRHTGNYGFLVDNDTYRVTGMAPIFDQDCSLGGFVSLQSVSGLSEAYTAALAKQPRTELGGYIPQAKMFLTNRLAANMKNMYPFHFKRLPSNIDIEDERIDFMEYIVNSQIKAILS